MEAVWILLLLGLSLSVSFLLSGMEAGALAVNRLRVRHLARRGDKAARLLAGYLDNPEQFLWVILVGNVLSNFLFLGVTLYWVHNWLGGRPWLWGIAALALVFALYTWGDLLPKMLFRSMPTRACLLAVRAYRLLDFLLAPLVRPLAWATDKAARLLGGRRYDGRLFGNREELLAVMRESAAEPHSRSRSGQGADRRGGRFEVDCVRGESRSEPPRARVHDAAFVPA